MKEYRIEKARDHKQAEQIMNAMAMHGWEVVTMTYWNKWAIYLLITFVREK